MKYGVVFESATNGVGAYLPDVPGVAVVGDDLAEALSLLDRALQMHVDGLIEDGDPIPDPTQDERGYQWFVSPERMHLTRFSAASESYIIMFANVASLWPTGPYLFETGRGAVELPPHQLAATG